MNAYKMQVVENAVSFYKPMDREEWFARTYKQELQINHQHRVSYSLSGQRLHIFIESLSGVFIKTLWEKANIYDCFQRREEGWYYKGDAIDGLGWSDYDVLKWYLEFICLQDIQKHYETIIDDIREVTL